ncbi:phytanoyl-CoA dioxygenase [Tolypothrix sp. PCC 7910]|uniref:phytanoyl-CoA dioxygenase n=1 Tax=Tolypothrix sp. PCC 7910 TaxID=2099387 RepID=UPI0014279443|nr:phytanoyl-CoA dioxygenase [Tolypothrix sp. PCC 7910]QIR38431.1 phytanoyl-CoA dioxygenase [Tolypothrix sp. PCC 7910]
MLQTIQRKVSALYSDLACALARWKHRKNLPSLAECDRAILKALKKDGVYATTLSDLGLNSTSKLLQAAYHQLSQMEKANNDELDERWPQIYTVTDIPAISAWATEKRLLNIIENYIGLPVKFHGVHLRKDFPSDHQFGTLLWHSDAEDRRIIKIFLSLKDVDEKTGPFEYIPRSLTSLFRWQYYWLYYKLWQSSYMGIDDEIVKKVIPQSAWKSCKGPAGTVIFADTKNVLHHGTVRTEERVTLFFCYTANPPERPELCTQYWDDRYPRMELNSAQELV